MAEIIQFLGILICSGLLISTVITQKMDKRNNKKSLESDNPFILTIQSMESELAELLENNRHMERIQRLEEQIKEARAHAEALSKAAGEYGSTMEEIGESMQRAVPKSRNMEELISRKNTAIYRTYTRQAGWSTYHGVKFK